MRECDRAEDTVDAFSAGRRRESPRAEQVDRHVLNEQLAELYGLRPAMLDGGLLVPAEGGRLRPEGLNPDGVCEFGIEDDLSAAGVDDEIDRRA
jgi:hypothetical protein